MYDTCYIIIISFLSNVFKLYILQSVCLYPPKMFQDIIIVSKSRVHLNLHIIEDLFYSKPYLQASKIASLGLQLYN